MKDNKKESKNKGKTRAGSIGRTTQKGSKSSGVNGDWALKRATPTVVEFNLGKDAFRKPGR